MRAVLGYLVILGLCWFFSEDRKGVSWRIVITGTLMQIVLAFILLKVPTIRDLFASLNHLVAILDQATTAGTSLVFGFLGGGAIPYEEQIPGGSFTLAFRALPLVLVVSALSSLLFYWGVLQRIVQLFSHLLQRTLGIGGALGVGAAANIFVGMVESPLLIRPYLAKMSRGELFAVMTCGMSTIAGTVMVLYATILQQTIPNILGHILIASVISAPAALLIAALMVPHSGRETVGEVAIGSESKSAMDAIVRGTGQGVTLLINIIAMLIVLVALVSIVNQLLGLLPMVDGTALSLERILGWLMAPIAWLIGIPWSEAATVGGLLGTKTILNEFIAYLQLAGMGEGALSERSRTIALYALCGFANFGSLGIMIGGMVAMVPERKDEIVSLGLKTIVSGTAATCLTGAIVGLLY